MFFSIGLLASILIGVGLSLRYKYNLDREKIRPFECGFTPKFSARLPFSIRFFMVAIIFLVFDVELIFNFPRCPGFNKYSHYVYIYWIIFLHFIFNFRAFSWNFWRKPFMSQVNKMAEIALVCKTIHEYPLLLYDICFENTPRIKNH